MQQRSRRGDHWSPAPFRVNKRTKGTTPQKTHNAPSTHCHPERSEGSCQTLKTKQLRMTGTAAGLDGFLMRATVGRLHLGIIPPKRSPSLTAAVLLHHNKLSTSFNQKHRARFHGRGSGSRETIPCYQRFFTFSAKPTRSRISSTVPSSSTALPLNVPNT